MRWAGLRPQDLDGKKIFIQGGAGGVGCFSIQLFKSLGCEIATTCSSKNIDLLSPDGTANPYYIEFGWKELGNQNAQLPSLDTIWKTDSSNLTPGNSVKLSWTSDDQNTFIINICT